MPLAVFSSAGEAITEGQQDQKDKTVSKIRTRTPLVGGLAKLEGMMRESVWEEGEGEDGTGWATLSG